MGLIVPKSMDNRTICHIADLLYRQSYHINVRLMVRQSEENPNHGFVRCLENEKCPNASDEMKKQGFKKGPPESPEFGVCDGEEIIICMAGNITLDSDIKTLCLKFYLNMDSASSTFRIDVFNKKAQARDKSFSGELRYNVGRKEQDPPRRGSMVLYIPKVHVVVNCFSHRSQNIIYVSQYRSITHHPKNFPGHYYLFKEESH